jgi:copper chaperone
MVVRSSYIKTLDLTTMGSFKLCFHQHKGTVMNQTFTVTGMTCGHCERAVKNAVLQIDPQAQVNIDRAANCVDVDSVQPREALAKAIADEGYGVAA